MVAKTSRPRTARRIHDLTGRQFGRLSVIGRSGGPRTGLPLRWRCRCSCGAERLVETSNLLSGNSQSCGCLRAEQRRQRALHGGAGTRAYRIWHNMIQRCHNPNNPSWPRYGGRGIVVCERWRMDFAAFLGDMGQPPPQLTIDRIDNDGPYAPENCRWVTATEQQRNRRSNRVIEHDGRRQPLAAWAEELRLPYFTLHSRLRSGWTVGRAFGTPVMEVGKYVR